MPTTLDPVDEHTANVNVPNDTEPANALSVREPFQALANRTHHHLGRIEEAEDDIEDLQEGLFEAEQDIANHQVQITDLEEADVLHEGRLDDTEDDIDDLEFVVYTPNFNSTSTAITSAPTNITVDAIKVHATLRNGLWIGSVYALVTNTGAGAKSFKITLGPTNFEALDDELDACGIGAVAFDHIIQVSGEVDTTRLILTWTTDSSASGTTTIRANFTYKNGAP